jgi:hypothetical protein
MSFVIPPPVLDCTCVIAYAHVDPSIPYLAKTALYVGGNLLGRVPALAICQNLAAPLDTLLLHCSEQWNVLGVSGAESVESAVLSAEINYPGLRAQWVYLNSTTEAALAYYDANFGGRCSFCGKRAFEVSGLVQGENACICRECVEDFFHEFVVSSATQDAT